jgi:surface polysaccharide O-acyltransferase-like enzyme
MRAQGEEARATIAWIDWARILGIFGVIVIHVVSLTVTAYDKVTAPAWWLATVLFAGAVWSVPLFVMISGALLLDPARSSDFRTFYRRRLGRIGVAAIGWPLVYWAWWIFGRGIDRPVEVFIRSMLKAQPYAHLHFLFIIVGLYLVAPFLRIFVANATRAQLAGAVALALTIATAQRFLAFVDLAAAPTAFTHFVPYIGYFLAGYLLRDIRLDRRQTAVAAIVAVACVVGSVASTFAIWKTIGRPDATFPEHYFSPFTIVLTLAVFLLIRTLFDRESSTPPSARSRFRSAIAAMTFGVFLIHPIAVDIVMRSIDIDADGLRAAVLFPATVIGVAVVSFAAVAVLRAIPLVRRMAP